MGKVAQLWKGANMTDDQRYQHWLQEHSPERQQAHGDMAEICVVAIVVSACVGSIGYFGYFVRLCVLTM